MKNARYKTVSLCLRFTLEFIFYLGLLGTAVMPIGALMPSALHFWWVRYYFWRISDNPVFGVIFIEVFGIAAVIIVRQLILIFKSVNDDKPFTKENGDRLKRIALCCFSLFGIFLTKTIIAFTPLTFLMTAALLIASFAALVFSYLFYLAVEYKHENDLTI